MFDHINRFKDDPRAFLRTQMRDFFGLEQDDIPPSLGEDDLLALYRANLKSQCGLRFAADLAIPHPTFSRTKFRLVVGGQHAAVVELFRDTERKVVGVEAAGVREAAAQRAEENRTKQLSFLPGVAPTIDPHYEEQHGRGLSCAPDELRRQLAAAGPSAFRDIWPSVLETHHVTKSELAKTAAQMVKVGELRCLDLEQPKMTVQDHHRLALPAR